MPENDPTPVTPHTPSSLESKPAPPLPATEDPEANSDSEGNEAPAGTHDPYSGLDGAFANYLQNEPRPMTAADQRHAGDLLI